MKTEHFTINTKGIDYFLGDLHGCYDAFLDKLNKVKFNYDTDRVFSVGDLADRGPNSEKCLGLLHFSWFHAVKGNHEDFILGSHDHYIWMMNGGDWVNTVDDLSVIKRLVENKMYDILTVDTKYGKVGVVHAESKSDWNDNTDLSKEINRWARTRIKCGQDMPIKNIDQVVVGHTPVKQVIRLGNILYIDTGIVFDGFLTLLTADEVFNKKFKRI